MPDANTRETAQRALDAKYPPAERLDRFAKLAAHLTFFGHHADAAIGDLLGLSPAELKSTRARPLYKREIERLKEKAEAKK